MSRCGAGPKPVCWSARPRITRDSTAVRRLHAAAQAGKRRAEMPHRIYRGHEGWVNKVARSGDALVSGGSDGTIRCGSLRSGQVHIEMRVGSSVRCLAISCDAILAACGSRRGSCGYRCRPMASGTTTLPAQRRLISEFQFCSAADLPYDAAGVAPDFEAELLTAWFQEAQRTDVNLSKRGPATRRPRGASPIQRILGRLGFSRTFGRVSESALVFQGKADGFPALGGSALRAIIGIF